MPLGTYNGLTIFEQGGSVLQIGSGGLVNFQSGATLTIAAGALLNNASSLAVTGGTVAAGAAIAIAAGGSLTVTGGSFDAGAFAISDGTRSPTISVGRNAPTFTASAGSLYIRSDGSMSNLYVMNADGTTGSKWVISTASG